MATTPKKQRGHTPGKSAAPTTRGNDTALRLEYDGQSVEFTGDGWINGTQVAERFGKRLRNWLRLAETQAYMRALAAAVNSSDVSFNSPPARPQWSHTAAPKARRSIGPPRGFNYREIW